jgi:hypothetical protein
LDVKGVIGVLAGHPPWAAQADGAIARIALAQGDIERAALAGGSALRALEEALHEDMNLDVVLPAARAILAGGDEASAAGVRDRLRLSLSGIVQRTLDEDARVRWLRGPLGRELAELAGPIDRMGSEPAPAGEQQDDRLRVQDRTLLHLLTQARSRRSSASPMRS